MDPNLLAMLLGQGQPQTTAMDLPPQYSPMADPGTQVAPQPQQDPREALMAALFAPPPEQQTEPKFRDMGTGGKIGLILSALGDIQNVRQRRSAKGARTFAPSNYTGEYLKGERLKLQEKHAMASRADQMKRQRMLYDLHRLDAADAERKAVARDAQTKAMDEAKNLRELQEAADMPGATRDEILIRRRELEVEKQQEHKTRQDKEDARAEEHLALSRKAGARAETAANLDKPDNAAIRREAARQTENVGHIKEVVNMIVQARKTGSVPNAIMESVGDVRHMTPAELHDYVNRSADALGLDEDHKDEAQDYFMKYVLDPAGASTGQLNIPQRR